MPQNRGKIEQRVREIESRLPVVFDWFTGSSQPRVGIEGITFWEDRTEDVAKILMRRKSRVYVFTAYPYDAGTNVTIIPNAHAHRHATGNSVATDVGLDPITPYSFTWTNAHLFQRTANVVSIKVDPSASGTEDPIQFLDTDGGERFVFTEKGLVAIGGGLEEVSLNVRTGGNAPNAVAPDVIATPLIWFRGDDDAQGHADASNALIITESATNNFSNFIDGSASGSSNGVEFHSAAGSENMLGHVCVSNRATATDLSLNGGENGDSGLYDASVKLTGDFTCLVVYGFIAAGPANTNDCWAIGAGRGNGTARSGVAVPNSQTTVVPRIYTDDGAAGNLTDIGVAYADATDGIRIGIFRRIGTTAKYFGTKTTGDTTVTLETTNANIAGDVHFNGLMSEGTSNCPIGVKFAEIVVYNSHLTDDQVNQLYQFYATRFGLTALSGVSSAQVRIDVDDTNYTYLETESDGDFKITPSPGGKVGINTSPSATLHALDTTEQLRLGYDATNYTKFTVENDDDFIIANATGNFIKIKASGRVGVNTATALARVDITDASTAQLRLSYDVSNYATFTVDSAGDMGIIPSGGKVGINTTSPQATLHIEDSTQAQLQLSYSTGTDYFTAEMKGTGELEHDITTDGTPNFLYNNSMQINEPINYNDTLSQDVTIPASHQMLMSEEFNVAQGASLILAQGARVRIF